MQPDIDDTVRGIKVAQVFRKFVIKMEVRIVNTTTALVARMCGYDAHDEEGREKNWKRAERIVRRTLASKTPDPADLEIAASVDAELGMARLALEPILQRRAEIETEMVRLAKLLPVASFGANGFIAATPGFNLIGLAVIVGEAGNLSSYPTIRKLWRRLGYGMAQGHESKAYSTWRKGGGLNADDWTRAGYSPQRLGQIYGVVTVPLMMHKNKNKYGAIYSARRERTLLTHPEWYADKNGNAKLTKEGEPRSAHAKMDAERIATKALLSDLWSEWRRSIGKLESRASVADAPPSESSSKDEPSSRDRKYPDEGYQLPAA